MKAATWNRLAETDAMWAILTDWTKYGGLWNEQEFFDIGEREISEVMLAAKCFELPRNKRIALDFGCGIGRIALALARRFDQVFGFDASTKMLELAKRHNGQFPNCEFLIAQKPLPLPDDSVDLVYSVLVLQHMSTDAEILGWISEFIRVVRSDGLVIFQLPGKYPFLKRLGLRRHLYAFGQSLGVKDTRLHQAGLTPISMRGIDPPQIARHIESLGLRLLQISQAWHKTTNGGMYFIAKP